ncbi:MAG TPA: DUF6526 family protein [Vicinamibacterales bacterium]|nr:DUF6526 family protein [Vicinamibacterales bacterium]
MPPTPQSYARHRRNRPVYWFVYVVFAADLVWASCRFVEAPSVGLALAMLTAIALIVLALYARVFALTVQDRVIRLEMRLRLKELLPAALQPRIRELSRGQLVALRFASDAELPELTEKVLRDNVHDRGAIKRMIKQWEADHLRA